MVIKIWMRHGFIHTRKRESKESNVVEKEARKFKYCP